jgi:hypothetical protein
MVTKMATKTGGSGAKTLRPAARLALGMALLAAHPALAADPSCPGIAIDAEAGLVARWPGIPERLRAAFDGREDVDACARVKLTRQRASIAVEVTLPDGRSATRSVSRPEDLVPTLEALLLVPEPPPPAAAPELPTAPTATPAPTPTPTATVTRNRTSSTQAAAEHGAPAESPSARAGGMRVELSLGTAARIGDGQAGGGVAARSVLELAGWLAGFEGRIDGYQGTSAVAPTGALELALLGGRRLRSGTLALDLIAGGALALQATSKSVTQAGSGAPPVTTSTSRADPRLVLGARLHFRALSTLRTFVGVEGEIGGAHPAAQRSSDLPPVPAWTVGLAFGLTVGTR